MAKKEIYRGVKIYRIKHRWIAKGYDWRFYSKEELQEEINQLLDGETYICNDKNELVCVCPELYSSENDGDFLE